jgi:hypothetical protein
MVFVPPRDRVLEHSTSNSQSVFSVTGALDLSYNAFAASMSVGDTTLGAVVEAGVAFKAGLLTYSAANQVTVTTAYDSKGTFSSSGVKEVFMGLPSASALGMQALGSSIGILNATLLESHSGNAVTFALKTLAGEDPSLEDPVQFVFPNGAGGYVVRSITAALSFTISAGSTMGFSSGIAGRLWLVAIDTGSTVVLGAVNALGAGNNIMALHPGLTFTSVAEGGAGAADLAQTIYSTAAQAGKFTALLGYADYDAGLVAAGNWAASPTRIILWASGAPRPGDVVRTIPGSTATVGTTSSSSLAAFASGLTLAITLASAANVVRARSNGSAGMNANSACGLQLARGSTLIGPLIGHNVPGSVYLPISLEAYDFPGAAGSYTYQVFGKMSSGVLTYPGAPSGTATLTLEELMA